MRRRASRMSLVGWIHYAGSNFAVNFTLGATPPRARVATPPEFVGCSPSLSGALRVNPWSIESVADGMYSALRSSKEERCAQLGAGAWGPGQSSAPAVPSRGDVRGGPGPQCLGLERTWQLAGTLRAFGSGVQHVFQRVFQCMFQNRRLCLDAVKGRPPR